MTDKRESMDQHPMNQRASAGATELARRRTLLKALGGGAVGAGGVLASGVASANVSVPVVNILKMPLTNGVCSVSGAQSVHSATLNHPTCSGYAPSEFAKEVINGAGVTSVQSFNFPLLPYPMTYGAFIATVPNQVRFGHLFPTAATSVGNIGARSLLIDSTIGGGAGHPDLKWFIAAYFSAIYLPTTFPYNVSGVQGLYAAYVADPVTDGPAIVAFLQAVLTDTTLPGP